MKKILSALLFLFSPLSAFAAVTDLFGAQMFVYNLLPKVGILFFIVAMVIFFWGIVKFISNASDTAEHEKGKNFIVGGLISFVVLVSIWGIVSLLLDGTSPSPVEFIDSHGNPVP